MIGQAAESVWLELTVPLLEPAPEIDLEVLYPDGETVRYSRGID